VLQFVSLNSFLQQQDFNLSEEEKKKNYPTWKSRKEQKGSRDSVVTQEEK
jgi:hypothetical protein